jgi:hypothetical protein
MWSRRTSAKNARKDIVLKTHQLPLDGALMGVSVATDLRVFRNNQR